MSTVREVVEVLARALTDRHEEIRVVETEVKGTIVIELYVAPGEVGRVVGKQGKTAAALRTLAATAGEKLGKTVTLEIRDGRR
ncbi:MAG: KH domain-containing protein [Vicinamibacterales bacterium]